MAFTPSFTASQTIGNPSIIILTDTSTGSDAAITQRRVYLQKDDGTYLVPVGVTDNFIVWPYADSTISLNVLSVDMALNIKVEWNDEFGDVINQTTNLELFTLYSEQFLYNLTQSQSSQPNVTADSDYYANKMALRVEIDSATNAIVYGSDIQNAQSCLNRAAYLIANSNLFF